MIRLLILLSLFLASCCQKQPTRFEGTAMTIPYCVQIGDVLEDGEIQKIILETFAEVDQIYNNWNPSSEVSQLKSLPADQAFELSDSLASFLAFVETIVRKTEGRFDPTVAPLHQLWKLSLREGHLPDSNEEAQIRTAIGWGHIHLKNKTFWKDNDLTNLDLCGVAKGYAVDLLVERLVHAGSHSIYVEWGGEIRTHGHHPTGRPWKVGIHGLDSIDLSDLAIATSGSYIQKWTINGVTYTHIIDPRTATPLKDSPITSVSVIAPTCAEADALATALMLFPSIEAAQAWAAENQIRALIW